MLVGDLRLLVPTFDTIHIADSPGGPPGICRLRIFSNQGLVLIDDFQRPQFLCATL